jgi:hypothetical protein
MPRNEFKNIPAVALAFVPLAAFEYTSAKRIFWVIDILALAGAGILVGSFLLPVSLGTRGTRIAFSLAVLGAFAPTHIALRHGQTTPLVLLALVGHLVAILRGRKYLSGALLALAGLVKIPLLLLAGLVIWNREWKTIVSWATTLGAAGIVSLLLFGTELHMQYVDGLTVHAGSVITGHNNQSVAAVVTRLMGPVPTFDWEPQSMSRGALLATMIVSAALLAALVRKLRRRPRTDGDGYLEDSVAVLALAIVALPVAWDHYFLLLAPGWTLVAVAALDEFSLRRRTFLVLVGMTGLALALPTPHWALNHAAELGLSAAALISHYFLGAVLMIGVDWKRASW